MERLQQVRDAAGPLVITSGVRCADHNARIGGVPDSAHVMGVAADIACRSSGRRMALIRGLLAAGFTRIGVAKTFVHVDADVTKPDNVLWEYSTSDHVA